MPKYPGVYKKGGRWYAYCDYRGKRYYVPGSYETAADAYAERTIFLKSLYEGAVPERGKIRVTDFFEKVFLKEIGCNYKQSSLPNVRCMFKKHIASIIGTKKVKDVEAIDIQRIRNRLNAKNLSPKFQNDVFSLTNRIFEAALQFGYISRNPTYSFRMLKVPKREKTKVSPEQIIEIIDVLPPREKIIWSIPLYAGLRPGEIFALWWDCLDRKNSILDIRQRVYRGNIDDPKTIKSKSAVEIPATLRRTLEEWSLLCPSKTWMFPSPIKKGKPLNYCSWEQRYFKPILEKYGLKMQFRDLRSLYAKLLRRLGIVPDVTKEQMRHTKYDTTLTFYSEVPEDEIHRGIKRLDDFISSVTLKNGLKSG